MSPMQTRRAPPQVAPTKPRAWSWRRPTWKARCQEAWLTLECRSRLFSPTIGLHGLSMILQTQMPTAPGAVPAAAGFANTLVDAIGSLSGLQDNADHAIAGLATNGGIDIHQAMIAMDTASLGMQLATQVRNKAVEAYQSLLNMQM